MRPQGQYVFQHEVQGPEQRAAPASEVSHNCEQAYNSQLEGVQHAWDTRNGLLGDNFKLFA